MNRQNILSPSHQQGKTLKFSFIDETVKASNRNIRKKTNVKTLRIRKALVNENLLKNYFVFNSETKDSISKYERLSDQDDSVGIVTWNVTCSPSLKTHVEETILDHQDHSPFSILDELTMNEGFQSSNMHQQDFNDSNSLNLVQTVPTETNPFYHDETNPLLIICILNYLQQACMDMHMRK